MKAYKGFNNDMTCRGFQYKEGVKYETDERCELTWAQMPYEAQEGGAK